MGSTSIIRFPCWKLPLLLAGLPLCLCLVSARAGRPGAGLRLPLLEVVHGEDNNPGASMHPQLRLDTDCRALTPRQRLTLRQSAL